MIKTVRKAINIGQKSLSNARVASAEAVTQLEVLREVTQRYAFDIKNDATNQINARRVNRLSFPIVASHY